MSKIDGKILEIDKVISANIDRFDDSERGLLSQNILAQLRNFIEHISLKIFAGDKDIDDSYTNICAANEYITTRGNLKFLNKFHRLLQISVSHYTIDWENSERLMLKYYEYLLRIKLLLKQAYGLDVLKNIDQFPINTDATLHEYYSKIAEKIIHPGARKWTTPERYYIQKIKPFFVNHSIYYEVTLTIANDKASKFDRIIAFTKLEISQNYAVKLTIEDNFINILGTDMPIQLITSWEVSIRPCELNKFADIFWTHPRLGGTIEIYELMWFITKTGLALNEIVNLKEKHYEEIRALVTKKAEVSHFFDILDKVRSIVISKRSWSNILQYLLYRMNNKIIKQQIYHEECTLLSNLYLKFGCIPFDQMPFNTSLVNHNPRLVDLFESVDSANREHELFARLIRNNTELKWQLYTNVSEIEGFWDSMPTLIGKYNWGLYYKHTGRRLQSHNNAIYIRWYVDDTIEIIEKLIELSSSGIGGYTNSVDWWLQAGIYTIDCDEKKAALREMFEKSRISLVYGSAWTGKSTLINHISHFFKDRSKLYLANTNPAVDNLKRKINSWNSTFKTIAKFLSPRNTGVDFDILIIDESSTVSNSDMLDVLKKANFKLLVLVGDTFQIESIQFGNWFYMAKYFIPATAIAELTKPYRSKNPKLLDLWTRVRNLDESILEHLTKNNYSFRLDNSIFDRAIEDEIILCLNYDGLYWINNINKFLQSSNPSDPIQWWVQTYKINDPILFNETDRFSPLIYNNMKWIITDIRKDENNIYFDIEIDKAINELDAEWCDFQLVWINPESNNSIISFVVNKYWDTDEDDESSRDTVVPFQIAYAVSIHKAQWLEYDSVKIVITDEVDEMITHNILYTAITRTKDVLKIYWTPETEKKVLENMSIKDSRKDYHLLKQMLESRSI